MRNFLTFFLLAFGVGTTQAQTKLYTMQEATLGLRTSLAPKMMKQLDWIPNESAVSFVTDDTTNPAFVRMEIPSRKTDTLLFLRGIQQRTSALKDSLGIRMFPQIQWLNRNRLSFQTKSHLFVAERDQKGWTINLWLSLPENAENVHLDNTKKQAAFTIENNLYYVDSLGRQIQVTNDKNKGIVNGQSVHQNEFGIDKGIFFSPKGNFFAFYRMDETMISDYPIIDWSQTPAVNKNKKYPMAGAPSHHVTLGVYHPASKKTIFLKTGEPKEQYLTNISWSPDERFVYIAILNRDQNHLWLKKYDAQTGEFLETLFEETDSKYVHPQHPLTFLPGSEDEFLWWSQRDGFLHLYRYNIKGKLLQQVTKGEWVVHSILGFHGKKKEVVFSATKESPMSRNIYAANWTNGRIRRLDQDFGLHQGKLNEEGTYLIDVFSNPEVPRKTEVRATQSDWRQVLLESENPLKEYARPEVRAVQLKADDGTDLFGKLILPTNFDEGKKYPVVVYLYNGPNVQLLQNGFPASGNLWYEYMAQRGFVVFTMDGRGSSNRGLKFEQAIFRQLGTVEMEDQLKGVAYLKSLPFVDSNRLGVHGWSYGGFMTTSLMLRHPGVFKVAVAGGPVIDWSMYEIMYTERYMDRPQDNPDGYEQANLLPKAKNLKGKLLMIHGVQDGVVVWQHSMKFLKACVDAGVQIDYFVYPNHEHNVLGKDRVHLMQKITDYFEEFL